MQHLSELIEEEMNTRGWTLDDLVMNMGPHYTPEAWGICHRSWEMFFALRTPDVILGDVMAQQLADAFDVDSAFFTNFHESWRKWSKSIN
jgi:hypothetical protein